MSDLRYHLDRLRESTERYHEDTRALIADVMTSNQSLWDDIASLRDEVNGLAELLTTRGDDADLVTRADLRRLSELS